MCSVWAERRQPSKALAPQQPSARCRTRRNLVFAPRAIANSLQMVSVAVLVQGGGRKGDLDADSEMIVCRPVIQVADKAPLTPWRRRSGSVVNPGEPAAACVPWGCWGPDPLGAGAARPEHRSELPEGLAQVLGSPCNPGLEPGALRESCSSQHPRCPLTLATATHEACKRESTQGQQHTPPCSWERPARERSTLRAAPLT